MKATIPGTHGTNMYLGNLVAVCHDTLFSLSIVWLVAIFFEFIQPLLNILDLEERIWKMNFEKK